MRRAHLACMSSWRGSLSLAELPWHGTPIAPLGYSAESPTAGCTMQSQMVRTLPRDALQKFADNVTETSRGLSCLQIFRSPEGRVNEEAVSETVQRCFTNRAGTESSHSCIER